MTRLNIWHIMDLLNYKLKIHSNQRVANQIKTAIVKKPKKLSLSFFILNIILSHM